MRPRAYIRERGLPGGRVVETWWEYTPADEAPGPCEQVQDAPEPQGMEPLPPEAPEGSD